MNSKKIHSFQEKILQFYSESGRTYLPWRQKQNLYRVLVSEIMLQQTQVDRVIPKYASWLKKYPSFKTLSQASLREVLLEWKGLGYPKRARALLEISKVIQDNQTELSREELLALPGVGDYTASAVEAFVYNRKAICIETNIRTVIIFFFFNETERVSEKQIRDLVEKTLPSENFRTWYAALMDYGAYLKKGGYNVNHKVVGHVKQKPFKGSKRELRGKVLAVLSQKQGMTLLAIKKELPDDRLDDVLEVLLTERMIRLVQKKYSIF